MVDVVAEGGADARLTLTKEQITFSKFKMIYQRVLSQTGARELQYTHKPRRLYVKAL